MKSFILFILFLLPTAFSLLAQDNLPGPGSKRSDSPVFRPDKTDDHTLMTFDGIKATSHIPHKFIKKRNTGIGITCAAVGVFALGTTLIATAPWQKRYSVYGNVSYATTPAGFIGVLMIPISIGLTIPGAVLWGRYASKIRRAQQKSF